MIQCKKCVQYVGETGQVLHCRMNNHLADIIHKKIEDQPVAAHFSTQRHSVEDMEVMVIDRLWKDDPVLQKNRESKWIRTLDTSYPKGMNLWTDTLWPHLSTSDPAHHQPLNFAHIFVYK